MSSSVVMVRESQKSDSSVPSPWLFNAPVDLLIGCGGWSLPLILVASRATGGSAAFLASAFYFLTVFCNNPHYMATVYRAYRSGPDFKQHRFLTVYATVLLIAAAAIVHLAPALFPWALTAYLIWSPWHYTGQNFGIAMLMARRAGAKPDHAARQFLFASYAASYAVWVIGFQSLETPDPGVIVVHIPARIADLLLPALSLAFACLTAAGLAGIASAAGMRAILAPALLSFTQGIWFLVPTLLQHYGRVKLPAAYYSAGVLAFLHCAQYLWVTTYHARRETEASPGNAPFRFGRYYATLILGGLALFLPGPWLASRLLGHEFVESFLIFAALVNLHHFILDGAIWKLRDNRIARLLIGRNPPEKASDPAASEGLPEFLKWLTGATLPARSLRIVCSAGIIGLAVVDQLQFRFSQKEAGVEGLSRAERMNSKDARVYFHRAQVFIESGKTNLAIAELAKAVEMNPRNAASQQLLGELLFKSGDTARALAHYNRMSELFPPDLATLMNRGLLAQKVGDHPLAARQFTAALRLSPGRIQLHYLLAVSFEALGQGEAAAEAYGRYIDLRPPGGGPPEDMPVYLDASLKLGNLDAAAGRWKEAAGRWGTAAEAAAANHPAEARRLFEKSAQANEHLGRLEDAIRARRSAGLLAAPVQPPAGPAQSKP